MGEIVPVMTEAGESEYLNQVDIEHELANLDTVVLMRSMITYVSFSETLDSVTRSQKYSEDDLVKHFIVPKDGKVNVQIEPFLSLVKQMPEAHKPFFYKMVETILNAGLTGFRLQNAIISVANLCGIAYKTTTTVDVIKTAISNCPPLQEYFDTLFKMRLGQKLLMIPELSDAIGFWATQTGRERLAQKA